jgi:hypothetical protein
MKIDFFPILFHYCVKHFVVPYPGKQGDFPASKRQLNFSMSLSNYTIEIVSYGCKLFVPVNYFEKFKFTRKRKF